MLLIENMRKFKTNNVNSQFDHEEESNPEAKFIKRYKKTHNFPLKTD